MWTDWIRDISFFETEKYLISKYYPTLEYIQCGDNIKLVGELYIKEIDDSYSIEVSFLDDYPNSLPLVKEIGGDIPCCDWRHINPDKTCCLCIPQLEKKYFPIGANIKVFLDNLVVPFFANQAYFDLTGKWLNGEYNHGGQGIYDFYVELFNTLDINKIVNLIELSINNDININKKCPCGSCKSLKKCHLSEINKLKTSANKKQLTEDLKEFKKFINKGYINVK